MAQSTYLASTLLMGILLVLTAALVARGRAWQRYTPQIGGAGRGGRGAEGAAGPYVPGESALVRVARSPATWYLGFLALTAAFGAGALLYVTGQTTLGLVLAGVTGAVLGLFFLSGVYLSARGAGHSNALAAAETATTLGLVLIVGVVVKLVAL